MASCPSRWAFTDLYPSQRGGQGSVHCVEERRPPGRLGALKMAHARSHDLEIQRRRFEREAVILDMLNRHQRDGIVMLYDHGVHQKRPFLVTEFVQGDCLGDRLRLGHQLLEKDVVSVMVQLGRTVHGCHDQGVIHRDLKPQNMILDQRGRLTLFDFGISLSSRHPDAEDFTHRYGTLMYMAPEAYDCSWSRVSDVYGIGAVGYSLLTGRNLFQPENGENVTEMERIVRTQVPEPPSRFQSRISPLLEQTILDCLHKDPDSRPRTALEVADRLQGLTPSLELICTECRTPRTDDNQKYCRFCGFDFVREKPVKEGTRLIIENGCRKYREVPLGFDWLTLGRRDINPLDATISREQALVVFERGSWRMENQGRSSLVYNGRQVSRAVLRPGDRIQFHHTYVRVVGRE